MKNFTIGANDAGQRIDRFLAKVMPELKASQIQKGIRTKNIKRNGKRVEASDKLGYGDIVTVFVQAAESVAITRSFLPVTGASLDVVFEDDNVIVMYKPAGMPCQHETSAYTLENYLRNHCNDSKCWNPDKETTFAPSICHRLDQNTEGFVIGAKTAVALRILNEKFKNREITKKYMAVVHGCPSPKEGRMEDLLLKQDKLVVVAKTRNGGAKTAELTYTVLEQKDNLTLVECNLITGRTHQIRVQFASRGWPLLGDGKYGTQAFDKLYQRKRQALAASYIKFDFKTDAAELNYLSKKFFARKVTFEQLCQD